MSCSRSPRTRRRAYWRAILPPSGALAQSSWAAHPETAVHQAVMMKRVVYDRSVVMAFRIQRELRRGGAFVALGALHLYGDKGVLALLEEDRYRSKRVY